MPYERPYSLGPWCQSPLKIGELLIIRTEPFTVLLSYTKAKTRRPAAAGKEAITIVEPKRTGEGADGVFHRIFTRRRSEADQVAKGLTPQQCIPQLVYHETQPSPCPIHYSCACSTGLWAVDSSSQLHRPAAVATSSAGAGDGRRVLRHNG